MKNFNKARYFIILIIIASLSALFFSLTIIFSQLMKLDRSIIELDNGYIFYRLQHESNPFDVEIRDFSNLYNELVEKDKENNIYTYYELYIQYLEDDPITDNAEKLFGGENGQIKCIQIGENVQYDFDLSLITGKLLDQNDFVFDGTNGIPVLMGYDYLDIFDIGEKFTCFYLFDRYDFRVIGFLKPDTHISTSFRDVELDSYIIMPSFNIEHNISGMNGLNIHYANKTSGFIKVSVADSPAVYNMIMMLIDKNKTGDYSVNSSSISLDIQNNIKISIEGLLFITILFAVLLLLLAIFLAIHYKQSGVKNYEVFAFFAASFCLYAILAFALFLFLDVRIDFLIMLTIIMVVCAILTIFIRQNSDTKQTS